MRALRYILLALAFITLSAQAGNDGRNLVVSHGASGKRIALVIGNGNYQADNLQKLANPPHDAEDIAKALRGFGFEVIERKDQSLKDMNDAIDEFSRKIGDSDAALFYYAGHGLQVKGQNFIIPVNAKIETEASVQYESVNVNRILDEMDNSNSRANIVMLDACRNNPISGKFRSGATRGLAAPTSTPKGTVIVYATDPGNVAADGEGRNGLFTAGLLAAFKGGDLSLHGVLVRASKEVELGSDKKQTPYVNGPMTLQEDFHFGQAAQVASLEPVPAPIHGGVSLDDIKKQQEARAQWDKWQKAMKADFDKIAELNVAPDLLITAWDRFLSNYAQDNPYSAEDKQLRAQALIKKQVAQELEAWQTAKKSNNLAGYKNYLLVYPNGHWAGKSKEEIGSIFNEGRGVTQDDDEAVKWYREAAEQGDGFGQLLLGTMYLNGWGVAKDERLAEEWFRKAETRIRTAAEQGDAEGQFGVGVMYENGQGVAKNEGEAVKWYRKAAEQGNSYAQYALGQMYENGQGVAKNEEEEFKWYLKAAEQGGPNSQNKIGLMYENGQGITKNQEEANKWYRKSAELGNSYAQSNLGRVYWNGLAVAKNSEDAAKWYRKSAEQGNSDAQNQLGFMYENGQGVAKNEEEAVKWYRKAAEQGFVNAQYNFGVMNENGQGVAKNEEEAVKWYRKAAEQGFVNAQYNFGRLYWYGLGVAKNFEEAAKWFRKAAEQGFVNAQYMLGVMYENGQGVAKNEEEAVKWYHKAAEQGSVNAQYNLGNKYVFGQGVAKNEDEAVKWYRKAAEQGFVNAQYNFGVMNENGQGVAKNEDEAVKWYRKAAEQGDSDAQNALKRLSR